MQTDVHSATGSSLLDGQQEEPGAEVTLLRLLQEAREDSQIRKANKLVQKAIQIATQAQSVPGTSTGQLRRLNEVSLMLEHTTSNRAEIWKAEDSLLRDWNPDEDRRAFMELFNGKKMNHIDSLFCENHDLVWKIDGLLEEAIQHEQRIALEKPEPAPVLDEPAVGEGAPIAAGSSMPDARQVLLKANSELEQVLREAMRLQQCGLLQDPHGLLEGAEAIYGDQAYLLENSHIDLQEAIQNEESILLIKDSLQLLTDAQGKGPSVLDKKPQVEKQAQLKGLICENIDLLQEHNALLQKTIQHEHAPEKQQAHSDDETKALLERFIRERDGLLRERDAQLQNASWMEKQLLSEREGLVVNKNVLVQEAKQLGEQLNQKEAIRGHLLKERLFLEKSILEKDNELQEKDTLLQDASEHEEELLSNQNELRQKRDALLEEIRHTQEQADREKQVVLKVLAQMDKLLQERDSLMRGIKTMAGQLKSRASSTFAQAPTPAPESSPDHHGSGCSNEPAHEASKPGLLQPAVASEQIAQHDANSSDSELHMPEACLKGELEPSRHRAHPNGSDIVSQSFSRPVPGSVLGPTSWAALLSLFSRNSAAIWPGQSFPQEGRGTAMDFWKIAEAQTLDSGCQVARLISMRSKASRAFDCLAEDAFSSQASACAKESGILVRKLQESLSQLLNAHEMVKLLKSVLQEGEHKCCGAFEGAADSILDDVQEAKLDASIASAVAWLCGPIDDDIGSADACDYLGQLQDGLSPLISYVDSTKSTLHAAWVDLDREARSRDPAERAWLEECKRALRIAQEHTQVACFMQEQFHIATFYGEAFKHISLGNMGPGNATAWYVIPDSWSSAALQLSSAHRAAAAAAFLDPIRTVQAHASGYSPEDRSGAAQSVGSDGQPSRDAQGGLHIETSAAQTEQTAPALRKSVQQQAATERVGPALHELTAYPSATASTPEAEHASTLDAGQHQPSEQVAGSAHHIAAVETASTADIEQASAEPKLTRQETAQQAAGAALHNSDVQPSAMASIAETEQASSELESAEQQAAEELDGSVLHESTAEPALTAETEQASPALESMRQQAAEEVDSLVTADLEKEGNPSSDQPLLHGNVQAGNISNRPRSGSLLGPKSWAAMDDLFIRTFCATRSARILPQMYGDAAITATTFYAILQTETENMPQQTNYLWELKRAASRAYEARAYEACAAETDKETAKTAVWRVQKLHETALNLSNLWGMAKLFKSLLQEKEHRCKHALGAANSADNIMDDVREAELNAQVDAALKSLSAPISINMCSAESSSELQTCLAVGSDLLIIARDIRRALYEAWKEPESTARASKGKAGRAWLKESKHAIEATQDYCMSAHGLRRGVHMTSFYEGAAAWFRLCSLGILEAAPLMFRIPESPSSKSLQQSSSY